MSITLLPADGPVAVVLLQGEITAAEFDPAAAIQHLIDHERVQIVLDCGGLTHVDDEAVGGLLEHLPLIREHGGDLRACALPSLLQGALITALREAGVETFGSRASAVASFARRRRPRLTAHQVGGPRGIVVIALRGVADAPSDSVKALSLILDRMLSAEQIVLDAREVTSLKDETFLGSLLLLDFRFAATGGSLRIVAPRELQVPGLVPGADALLASYATLDAALVGRPLPEVTARGEVQVLHREGVHELRLLGRLGSRERCAELFGALEQLRADRVAPLLLDGAELTDLPRAARHALGVQLRGLSVRGAKVAVVPEGAWFLPPTALSSGPRVHRFEGRQAALAWLRQR
ncbi:MAG: STAS domain-containing protein [Planctomycetota bacterium]